MRRYLTAVAALLVAGCADQSPTSLTPRDARATNQTADDPKIAFDVTGFTYGPNFEEIHVHTCSKGFRQDGYEYWVWDYYDERYDRPIPIWVITGIKIAEPCTALSGSYSEVYQGGTISIGGSTSYGGIGLGSTPARWDVIKNVADFPISADVILTAYTQDSGICPNPRFERWILDNDWGAPRYGNPLVMPASELAYRRVSAEFFCNETPPPPPPDDDDPPYCDDPTTCDGGGNSLSPGTVTPLSQRKPSTPKGGKKSR